MPSRSGYAFEVRACTPARCCGRAVCTSECKAVLWYGRGHQSRTHCELTGEHDVHEARGSSWVGKETCTGFFDEEVFYEEADAIVRREEGGGA